MTILPEKIKINLKKCLAIMLVWSKVKLFNLINKPLKIVLGSGGLYTEGWIPTDIFSLNILKTSDWNRFFRVNSISALMAEHVWEHLEPQEAVIAAKNCYKYLKHGGYIRIAVPDGLHCSKQYIDAVKPGGNGSGSHDHKVLYDYKSLSKVFEDAGFKVELLEYFDEAGRFNEKEWDSQMGLIVRSKKYDERNKMGQLNYTSIIIDAWKN